MPAGKNEALAVSAEESEDAQQHTRVTAFTTRTHPCGSRLYPPQTRRTKPLGVFASEEVTILCASAGSEIRGAVSPAPGRTGAETDRCGPCRT